MWQVAWDFQCSRIWRKEGECQVMGSFFFFLPLWLALFFVLTPGAWEVYRIFNEYLRVHKYILFSSILPPFAKSSDYSTRSLSFDSSGGSVAVKLVFFAEMHSQNINKVRAHEQKYSKKMGKIWKTYVLVKEKKVNLASCSTERHEKLFFLIYLTHFQKTHTLASKELIIPVGYKLLELLMFRFVSLKKKQLFILVPLNYT